MLNLEVLNMELIEFFDKTNHRNLKFNIDFMVKQRLRFREEELEMRRMSLYNLLERENLQYNAEIALVLRARLEENARKRQEWIGTMRLERERAEEQLLELKKQQREIENSEEMRHYETQHLLLKTKQAQLYQIEEKKVIREKEKQIERMWLEALRRLNEEKAESQILENKLQNVIAGCMQKKNIEQLDEMKKKQSKDAKSLKKELKEDNERAASIDKVYKEKEKIHERRKKLHHGDVIQQQIKLNKTITKLKQENEANMDKYKQYVTDVDTQKNLERKYRKEVENREWHKHYLEHTQNERQTMQHRNKVIDSLLTGKECVLYQQNKSPYNKEAR